MENRGDPIFIHCSFVHFIYLRSSKFVSSINSTSTSHRHQPCWSAPSVFVRLSRLPKKHKIFHQLWTNRCSQKKNGEGGQGIPCRLHPKSIANSHNFLLESFSILRVPSFGGWKSHVKYCISPFFEGFQHHHPGTCSAFNLTRLRFLSTTIATDDLLVGLPPSRELEFKNPPKKLLSTRNYRM